MLIVVFVGYQIRLIYISRLGNISFFFNFGKGRGKTSMFQKRPKISNRIQMGRRTFMSHLWCHYPWHYVSAACIRTIPQEAANLSIRPTIRNDHDTSNFFTLLQLERGTPSYETKIKRFRDILINTCSLPFYVVRI